MAVLADQNNYAIAIRCNAAVLRCAVLYYMQWTCCYFELAVILSYLHFLAACLISFIMSASASCKFVTMYAMECGIDSCVCYYNHPVASQVLPAFLAQLPLRHLDLGSCRHLNLAIIPTLTQLEVLSLSVSFRSHSITIVSNSSSYEACEKSRLLRY